MILHPEGNVNNNPNLLAILELFYQQGCYLDVLSKASRYIYQNERKDFKIHLVKDLNCLIRHRNSGFYKKVFLDNLFKNVGAGYDLIIGVDREGLLLGDAISRLSGTPLGLISYEILFAAEVGTDKKREENEASKNLLFAVCQDEVRAEKLSFENGIPLGKIICIPVSQRSGAATPLRSSWLRDQYGIGADKKIALYMGSIESWAGFDVILDDLGQWPDDWVLVLHGRYKLRGQFKKLKRLPRKVRQKVFLSDQPFESFEDLAVLPQSADVGIALYYPNWQGGLLGDNLKYLGWSSGKVCTYLQWGLPVLVNEIGLIAEAVRSEGLGYVVNDQKKVSTILSEISLQDLVEQSQSARRYFVEHLDFDKHAHKLTEMLRAIPIKSVISDGNDWNRVKNNIDFFYLWSFGPIYDIGFFLKKRCRKFLLFMRKSIAKFSLNFFVFLEGITQAK